MRPNRTKRECPHRGGKSDGYDNPEVGSAIRKKGQDEKDDDFRKQDSRIRMAHDPPKSREVQSSRSPNAEHEHEKGGAGGENWCVLGREGLTTQDIKHF